MDIRAFADRLQPPSSRYQPFALRSSSVCRTNAIAQNSAATAEKEARPPMAEPSCSIRGAKEKARQRLAATEREYERTVDNLIKGILARRMKHHDQT